jgi:hypothetical protein
VELAYEFTVATGEATVHEPVAVTPISLDEYEAAKWDVVVDRDRAWYPEVPDLGALTGGRLIFQEHLTLLDDWANQWATLYVSMDLLGGPQVDWRLLLPPCQEL